MPPRPTATRLATLALALALLAAAQHRSDATEGSPLPSPSVGLPAKVDQLLLPGTELEAAPIEGRQAKLVLRVIDVFPHGSAFRYNLAYYGLEPGTFDLKDYLRRKDRSPTADLPRIPVTVRAILPPGQVEPNALRPSPAAFRGGYRLAAGLAVAAWVAGLLVILFLGRRRKGPTVDEARAGGSSLAERIKPLVEDAMAGKLGPGQHAELERMLIGYWRARLGLESASPARAIAAIRADPVAGALLRQLENWLHRPEPADEVDVVALLEPYRELPAEAETGGPAIPGRVG